MKKTILSSLAAAALAFVSVNASASSCHYETQTYYVYVSTCNYIHDSSPFEPIERQFTYESTSGYQQCPGSMDLYGYPGRLLDEIYQIETRTKRVRVCEDN